MIALYWWSSLSLCCFIFFMLPVWRRWLKWLFHGPCVRALATPDGQLYEYSDGYIEFEIDNGELIDVERSLYETERAWQLCGTRYGENGTVTPFRGTFQQMTQHVETGCGVLTFVDVVTGLVHYRSFE